MLYFGAHSSWLLALALLCWTAQLVAADDENNILKREIRFEILEENLSEQDWRNYIEGRDEIIKKTADFPKNRLRPYKSKAFQVSSSQSPAWTHWATDPVKLGTFKNHLDSFTLLTKDESYLYDDSKIADLLSHIIGVDGYLTASGLVNSLKELLVVIFGHESTGKSSLLDEYLGLDMSFTSANQGTLQPISYHVYKKNPSVIPPNKFTPGDPVFYWDTTVATADATKALTIGICSENDGTYGKNQEASQ
jgi:hypothetical protein